MKTINILRLLSGLNLPCAAQGVMVTIFTLALGFPQGLSAMEPPPQGYPGRGRSAGIAPDLGIGNMDFSPDLVAGFVGRFGNERGPNLLNLRDKGLPSTGSPKMLVLLIDFDEYPARLGDTPEAMHERIFGGGGQFPYESLSAYYRRSSYGKLNLDGNVLGWYHAGRRSDVTQTGKGREALIRRALRSYTEHDFSQYDSDGDGQVDYFAVIWTGPVGEWATFWWAVAPKFSDRGFTVGGKRLNAYAWQGVANKWEDPAAEFQANILIHETGHALGLPDYYDYKPEVGPKGGLGYMDMMDASRYDHNCFSKMMLGWIEPRVLTAAGDFSLRSAAESGDCVMIMPHGQGKDPFGEFFLVENRRRTGNDSDTAFPGGGLVIWHVDARLNGSRTNFRNNNSTTGHKLLKILEADGLEELETGARRYFGLADFYLNGSALGPDTTPSSRLYDGSDTGISLLSTGGEGESFFSVGIN